MSSQEPADSDGFPLGQPAMTERDAAAGSGADPPPLVLPADFWQVACRVVAVSGGSDSLALLLALLEQRAALFPPQVQATLHGGPRLVVFHFDHRWTSRSRETAAWVVAQMQAWDLETRVRTRDATSGSTDIAPQSEGEARASRYAALREVAAEEGASYVLTGHTQDDQVETILMRLARGTGLAGLVGIPRQRPLFSGCQLLRPLLGCDRQSLRQYLAQVGQPFVEDPTNDDPSWTRNRIRGTVLPWLRQYLSGEIDRALLRLASAAGEHQALVQHVAHQYRGAVLECTPTDLVVDIRSLTELPPAVVRFLLVQWWTDAGLPAQEMNRGHWLRLTNVARRPPDLAPDRAWPSQLHLPGPIHVKRSAGLLHIHYPSRD